MLLAIILLSSSITPQSISEPAPIICTSSMDIDGKVSAPPCLAPNTGSMPSEFVVPEGDRN
jgi:hypothetical protein